MADPKPDPIIVSVKLSNCNGVPCATITEQPQSVTAASTTPAASSTAVTNTTKATNNPSAQTSRKPVFIGRGASTMVTAPPRSKATVANTTPASLTIFEQELWCRRCHPKDGGRRAEGHNSWCSQHPNRETNGSIPILNRIRHGLSVKCKGCYQEAELGRLLPEVSHSIPCMGYQQAEQQRLEERQRLERERKFSEEQAELQRIAQERARVKRLLEAEQKRRKQAEKELEKRRDEERRRAKWLQSHSDEEEEAWDEEGYRPRKRSKPVQKPARVTPSASAQARGELQARWVRFDGDPWGPSGHLIGDIMLFGPPAGVGHHDVTLPSPRYNPYPFAENSRYCLTHRTPEEGLTVVVLERDPMSAHPWGFQMVRDEFGQGCIVNRVDACSPATAAVSTYIDHDLGVFEELRLDAFQLISFSVHPISRRQCLEQTRRLQF